MRTPRTPLLKAAPTLLLTPGMLLAGPPRSEQPGPARTPSRGPIFWADAWAARHTAQHTAARGAACGAAALVGGDVGAGASVACRARRTGPVPVGDHRCGGFAPIDQLLADRGVLIRGYRRLSERRVARITDHPAVYRAPSAIDAATP